MGFFGSKPTLRARASSFHALSRGLQDIASDRTGFDSLIQADLRDLRSGRKSDLRSITDSRAADVQFAASGQPRVRQGDITDAAINRAKGLTSVIEGTKTEFDQSILQQRIAATQGGFARRGLGLRALGRAGNLQDAFTKQKDVTDRVGDDIRSEQIGTAAGVASGLAGDFLSNRKPKRTTEADFQKDFLGISNPSGPTQSKQAFDKFIGL